MAKDSSTKKIYGLIGYPVKHSLSPAMHNAAFHKLNINAEYRLFEVPPERLEEFLLEKDKIFEDTNGNSIRSGDILGFNITVPHKVAALIKNAAIVTCPEVLLVGAVNTVKRDNDKLRYRNTDSTGFIRSLREDVKFDTNGKRAIIFGCGGAGRAVLAGLSQERSGIKKIYLYDSNIEVAKLAREHFSHFDFVINKLEFISFGQIPDKIKDCELLINASPVGMKDGDSSIIDKKWLHSKLAVYDVVYNRQTQLIRDAKSLGLIAVNGLGMLLYQGADAFELWTGKKAPVDEMRKALLKAL